MHTQARAEAKRKREKDQENIFNTAVAEVEE